jgi:hypothetical protein
VKAVNRDGPAGGKVRFWPELPAARLRALVLQQFARLNRRSGNGATYLATDNNAGRILKVVPAK